MTFGLRNFEQFFKDSTLRKGLTLFVNGQVELLEHPQRSQYKFAVLKEDVQLKTKDDKILSWLCSCGRSEFCEHLGASLFYLQKPLTEFLPNKKNFSLKRSQTKEARILSDSAQKKWIDYKIKTEELIRPFLLKKVLDQKQIDLLYRKLRKFLGQQTSRKQKFYFNLALFLNFSKILQLRLTGNEKKLYVLRHDLEEALDKFFQADLNAEEKLVWKLATTESIKTNQALSSRAFYFLIPRFLNLVDQHQEVEMLNNLLAKRKYSQNNADSLNKLIITKLQVKAWLGSDYELNMPQVLEPGAELAIAKAETYFINGKFARGFKILESDLERVRKNFRNQYHDYLAYVGMLAWKHKQKDFEIKVLEQKMMYGLFIRDEDILRISELLKPADLKEVIKKLIFVIRGDHRLYVFEKLHTLMIKAGMIDELIQEIKKQNNKFRLLHQLLVEKLPVYSSPLLALYATHLSQALYEGKYFQVQQGIFETAREYLSLLPSSAAAELLTKILDKLGHQAQISKYIVSEVSELNLQLL